MQAPADGVAPPPLLERTSVRRGLAVTAIVVAGAVAVVAKVGVEPIALAGHGVYRLATEGFTRSVRPEPISEPPAPRPHDAMMDLPPDVRDELLNPAAFAGQSFRYALAVPPAVICERMAAAGIANTGWIKAAPGDWSCMSDLIPVPGTRVVTPDLEDLPEGALPEPARSTVFFTARGRSETDLQVIRFKLNLDDPSVDAAGRRMLLDLIAALSGPLSWSAPPAIVDAVKRHRRFTAEHRGILVQIHPELGLVKRLNVVLVLTRPALRLPPSRFIAAPPMPPSPTPEPDRTPRPAVIAAPETPPAAE